MSEHDQVDADQNTIFADRMAEALESSISSMQSEFEQAEGWLRESTLQGPADFAITALAGALGALADAWGRLTLRSRANGTYGSVQAQLEQAMDNLVQLRMELGRRAPEPADRERLRQTLQQMEAIYQQISG